MCSMTLVVELELGEIKALISLASVTLTPRGHRIIIHVCILNTL